ncbi:MCE family protein [Nocardioides sp. BGMRC 2183]|nr:MCE family protein [Nocardioides sp. BGMRC 2183]
MTSTMTLGRARDLLLGLGYVGLVVAVGVGTWLFYNQAFTDRAEVTLTTGTVGNALQKGSDVKLHGVPVGKVSSIDPQPGGAELTLALQPEILDELPATTTARLLPKTLFGERYVALMVPAEPAGGAGEAAAAAPVATAGDSTLRAGDTIVQDTSDEAVELEEVFDELLPVLEAIRPDKLSAMLGELALMLRGNGGPIGDTLAAWGRYLERFNPLTERMADDLAAFGRVAQDYAIAAPDLLDALATMTDTSGTLVDERVQLTEALRTVTSAGDASHGWMLDNSETITVLSRESRDALSAVAPYASQFPCLFRSLRDYVPEMEDQLGKGTDEPGLHVVLNVEESRGRYLAGKDAPRYESDGRPRCPYQPSGTSSSYSPDSPDSPAGPANPEARPGAIPAPPIDFVDRSVRNGLGPANSVEENQLIAEILAPTVGLAPAEFPDWSSLLLGPVLRGTEVELR